MLNLIFPKQKKGTPKPTYNREMLTSVRNYSGEHGLTKEEEDGMYKRMVEIEMGKRLDRLWEDLYKHFDTRKEAIMNVWNPVSIIAGFIAFIFQSGGSLPAAALLSTALPLAVLFYISIWKGSDLKIDQIQVAIIEAETFLSQLSSFRYPQQFHSMQRSTGTGRRHLTLLLGTFALMVILSSGLWFAAGGILRWLSFVPAVVFAIAGNAIAFQEVPED